MKTCCCCLTLPTGVYLISMARFLITLSLLSYMLLSVGDLSDEYDPIVSGLTLAVGAILVVALIADLGLFLGVRFRSPCLLGGWLPWCLVTLGVNILGFWWTVTDPMYQREVFLRCGIMAVLTLFALCQIHSFFAVIFLIKEIKSQGANGARENSNLRGNAKEMKPLRQYDA